MKRKFFFFALLLPFLLFSQTKEKTYHLTSPGKKVAVTLHVSEDLRLSATLNGSTVLLPSEIGMQLKDRYLGKQPRVKKTRKKAINQKLYPVVREKQAEINDRCNELRVDFKGDYYLVLRAYDNGFAYRFGTRIPGEIKVVAETGSYEFPEGYHAWWGHEVSFESHNEVTYRYRPLKEIGKKDLASLPLLIDRMDGTKILITETALLDYPGMWMRGNGKGEIYRVSPRYPKTLVPKSDRYLKITEREDYIARTKGTRVFPWRIFAVSEKDADLITNQLSYIMAPPLELENTSWIRPGKVAWDWWNANNIYGVDFKSGINTETYKYYIDFAAKYSIEYILLDEGWYELGDVMKVVPDIDMEEIVSYARQKNVDVILWVVWKTFDDKMDEALDQFEKWGIKGIKVDFMMRDDQEMVNFYQTVAKKAAAHHLLVDFHGSYKPSGLRRIYPNVITREGVRGNENVKWSNFVTTEHDLTLPFTRMVAGPMDFTPGAMRNATKKDFKPVFDNPMGIGTRSHQLAMYVVFESPLQMLCDSPSNYYREPEAMEFLSAIPTVWDETRVLEARVSDVVLIARRNGNNWYVGGMTDEDARDLTLDLSFLPKGKKYRMTLYRDGINADRIATDFIQIKKNVDHTYRETVHLAPGGGLALMLIPEN